MFCPKCRSEYVEEMTECADCGMPLVDELAPLPEVDYDYEDFVPVKTYPARYKADFAKGVLEANGIEAYIATDDAGTIPPLDFTGGVRLLVKLEDADRAEEIFQDLENTPSNIDESFESSPEDDATDVGQ